MDPDAETVIRSRTSRASDLATALEALEQDATEEVAAAFARLAAGYFAATRTGEGPVSTQLRAADLAARFDEPLPIDGRPASAVLDRLVDEVLPDCNRLLHPRAMGHQVSAPLAIAVWTDMVTSALNQSAAVWEMSPIGTLVETQVIRWLCGLAGFGAGSGGTFTSGGTEATFAALLAARHAVRPDAWRTGLGADPPFVVCGEHAHYAVMRAVGTLGLGTDHLVTVPSVEFRMDVRALEPALDRLRAEGRTVMAVVASAGTTATGSFDDLDAVASRCEARGIWLHVDGAHGASALFSESARPRLAGLQRAQSLAWDPHKMMLVPLAASVVLVRRESDLDAAFSQRAPYLFHGQDGERIRDQGIRSFQCSRRLDAFKVWVALQRHGARTFGALYDHLCGLAATLHGLIAARDDFDALHVPESNILCFRYVGDRGRPVQDLDGLNLALRQAYNREGDGWITTTVLDGARVLRVAIMNPRTTVADLQRVLDGLASIAKAERRSS